MALDLFNNEKFGSNLSQGIFLVVPLLCDVLISYSTTS